MRSKYGLAFVTAMILMIAVPRISAAQQVVIEGYVTDSITHNPLYPATILNKTMGVAAFTDSSGYYKLRANNGDEINFSFLGYFTLTYVVPLGLTNIIHNIELIPKAERLKGVTVRSLTPYQLDSLNRANTFRQYLDQQRVQTINTRAHSHNDVPNRNYNDAFGIELNPFSLFSKRNKNKRSFEQKYPQMEQEAFIHSRYTPELVKKLTGLSGDSLSLFMYENSPDYHFTRHASDLEFWSWIKIRYKAWLKPK